MKHPYSVRLAAVQHYLSGKATLAETARHFHVGESPLIRWVRAFRNQGEAGLTHRLTRHYSPEFKLRVVRYVLDNRCSSADASAHFAIPNETVIQNWLRKYRSGGSVALVNRRSGPAMKTNKPDEDKSFSDMTHKELLRELEYLRAENAYLKKLKALREENGLREQQQKQK